ncbi:hypothetical protein F5X68DRAFT_253560, partial [Plectosphaerella plurivora]
QNASRIFQWTGKNLVYFSDLDTDEDGVLRHYQRSIQGLVDLQAHLNAKQSAPHHRFIHITSKWSRSPLGCSQHEMDLILTNHQVMASFVEILLKFQRRETPYALTTFRIEDHLKPSFRQLALKPLNRSGIRLQHCFNVLGIEEYETGSWSFRQVGVYHSFDVQEARSTWVFLKGDFTIKTRLTKALESALPLMNPKAPKSTSHSFGETLEYHLLILQWCAEGWAEYAEDMESKRRDTTVLAKISLQQTPMALHVSSTSGYPTTDNFSREPRIEADFSLIQSLSRRVSKFAAFKSSGLFRNTSERLGRLPEPPQAMERDIMHFADLAFKKLQTLRSYAVEIQDMMSRIENNARVIESIATRYHNLVRSRTFTQYLNEEHISGCQEYVDDFEGQLHVILGSLESFRSRLRTIHDQMEHEGDAFNHILQAHTMFTADMYAQSTLRSADSMNDKTVSMHIITIFTLIFLPGTFVATIFSSGILTFGQDGEFGFGSDMGDWKKKPSETKAEVLMAG